MFARRSIIRTAAAAAVAGLAKTVHGAGKEKATALALIGDRYHNSDYIRTALGKTLVKDLGVSIDFTDELKALNAGALSGYKLLIMFRDGMIWPDGYPDNMTYPGYAARAAAGVISDPPAPKHESKSVAWITPEQGKAVKEFVSKGGGILFYHNVTYISPHNQDFRDVLGAVTHGHPPLRPFKVKVVAGDHPITRLRKAAERCDGRRGRDPPRRVLGPHCCAPVRPRASVAQGPLRCIPLRGYLSKANSLPRRVAVARPKTVANRVLSKQPQAK